MPKLKVPREPKPPKFKVPKEPKEPKRKSRNNGGCEIKYFLDYPEEERAKLEKEVKRIIANLDKVIF